MTRVHEVPVGMFWLDVYGAPPLNEMPPVHVTVHATSVAHEPPHTDTA